MSVCVAKTVTEGPFFVNGHFGETPHTTVNPNGKTVTGVLQGESSLTNLGVIDSHLHGSEIDRQANR